MDFWWFWTENVENLGFWVRFGWPIYQNDRLDEIYGLRPVPGRKGEVQTGKLRSEVCQKWQKLSKLVEMGKIFKNSNVLFEFCNGSGGSWSKSSPPPKHRGTPPPRLKNYPKLGKNGRFLGFLYEAPRILGGCAVSHLRVVAPLQNYNSASAFWKFFRLAEIYLRFCGLPWHSGSKIRLQNPKKGG